MAIIKSRKPLLILLAVLAAAGVAAFLLLNPAAEGGSGGFDAARLAAMDERGQQAQARAWLESDSLAEADRVALLKWLFTNRPELGEELVRANAAGVRDLPAHLSRACYEALIAQDARTAGRMLDAGRSVYPNDPYVLGVSGVAAFLSGRNAEAIQLLGQAEAWRRDVPMVDFYLGGLLSQSGATAERARGKALLLRVIRSRNAEFGELAGLALLTNRDIPVIASEFGEVFELLAEAGAFRLNSPNLNDPILRVLLNRAVELHPQGAIRMAELLLQYPHATAADRLVAAQLAQSLGEKDKAQAFIDGLSKPPGFADDSPEARLLARVQAVQKMLTGAYEEGLEEFAGLVADQDNHPGLADMVPVALAGEPPRDVERRLLGLLLELRSARVQLQLGAVQRLVEIDPVRDQAWKRLAAERLLAREPALVGTWLTASGAPDLVIEFLGTDTAADGASVVVLLEACLAKGDTARARAVLTKAGGQVDPGTRALLEARVFLQEGKRESAYEKWQEARNIAMNTDAFPLLKNLGFLALQLDQPVTALQSLYTAFSGGVPFPETQAQTLLEITLKYGNLQQSIKVATYLNDTYPGNPVHQNNLAYFRFLAEQDMDASVEVMRKLVDAYPDVTNYRLTLALGLFKLGRSNEASRIVEGTSVDWDKAGNRAQLIYAAILAANNQRTVAEVLVRGIDRNALIPEERALLENM